MRALLPGSFDPITIGHLAVIEEAAARYDSVTVGVFINPDKTGLFPHEVRVELIRLATAHLQNVDVLFSCGMVADLARDGGYDRIVKGVRSEEDRVYEEEMAAYNLARGGVPTELLPARESLVSVSSTAVRAALLEDDKETLSALLPSSILGATLAAYKRI